MGFNANGCRRAVYATAGQGLEAAMNWVLEHMSDADFDKPYEPPQLAGTKGAASVHAAPSLGQASSLMCGSLEWCVARTEWHTREQVSFADEVVEAITAMGFTRPQAVKGWVNKVSLVYQVLATVNICDFSRIAALACGQQRSRRRAATSSAPLTGSLATWTSWMRRRPPRRRHPRSQRLWPPRRCRTGRAATGWWLL